MPPTPERLKALMLVVNATMEDGENCLHHACRQSGKLTELLVGDILSAFEVQPDSESCSAVIKAINTPRRDDGITPLHVAVSSGSTESVTQLLNALLSVLKVLPENERLGVLMSVFNATGEDGYTPLHRSVALGNIDVATRLLETFQKSLDTLPESEKTGARMSMVNPPGIKREGPLFTAVEGGNDEMVHRLLESGADPTQRYFRNSLGKHRVFRKLFSVSPKEKALQNGDLQIADRINNAIRERQAVARSPASLMEAVKDLEEGRRLVSLELSKVEMTEER